jgi:Carboxypeptidase regulatory-like domain
MSRSCLRTLATAFVCLLPAITAGQGRTTGQIVGTVKDATGAVVQNAEVVLIETSTKASVTTRTGTNGNFTFPNLQPGHYTVTA